MMTRCLKKQFSENIEKIIFRLPISLHVKFNAKIWTTKNTHVRVVYRIRNCIGAQFKEMVKL